MLSKSTLKETSAETIYKIIYILFWLEPKLPLGNNEIGRCEKNNTGLAINAFEPDYAF